MEIISKKTSKSPEITFDNGDISIVGRSYIEDSVAFYKPLKQLMEAYGGHHLRLIVYLDFFNTSSSKCLLELFRIVERACTDGRDASIVWKYQAVNSDMCEAGEDYHDLLPDVPFEFVSVE